MNNKCQTNWRVHTSWVGFVWLGIGLIQVHSQALHKVHKEIQYLALFHCIYNILLYLYISFHYHFTWVHFVYGMSWIGHKYELEHRCNVDMTEKKLCITHLPIQRKAPMAGMGCPSATAPHPSLGSDGGVRPSGARPCISTHIYWSTFIFAGVLKSPKISL